jgi:hypothetical protein
MRYKPDGLVYDRIDEDGGATDPMPALDAPRLRDDGTLDDDVIVPCAICVVEGARPYPLSRACTL